MLMIYMEILQLSIKHGMRMIYMEIFQLDCYAVPELPPSRNPLHNLFKYLTVSTK